MTRTEAKFRELLRHFAHDLDAITIASLVQLTRNTVNRYLNLIRKRIADFCEQQSPFKGEIEVDESYFGGKRIKGKRGRGGKVYTEIVPDCAKATLQGIICGRVDPDSVIHSDAWRGYNGLVDLGFKKHYRVNHGSDEFVNRKSHINGIESFWSYAKRRLAKFHGINDSTFYLHLKECEFRFNFRDTDIYKMLLKMFSDNPLF